MTVPYRPDPVTRVRPTSPASGSDSEREGLAEEFRILERLRRRLQEKQRNAGGQPRPPAQPIEARVQAPPPPETPDLDRYEPQRLTRKICWQYDQYGKRVPLLRRPYI